MTKYRKYAEYKDSGVEWLEKIPSHWKASYVGVVSDVIDPQPDHRAPAISENGDGFPYIGIRDVNKDGTLNFETARPVEESAVIKQEQSFTIEPHNIIFCKVGTLGLPRKIIPHGRCALSATLVLIKARKIESQFLLYALDSDCIISQTNFVATGSTRAALGIQQIRKFRIPLPSNSEQIEIASFLDHETAKIDTLIAKQEKLIELLKEKRQAVISHAVTKGLNPNVPMKDSGVEWLGEVPEHWKVIKFNHVVQIRNGLVDPRDDKFKNLILYAPNHIEKATGKILYKETAEEQGADSNKYLCFKGEVIYSKIRPALAKVAICEEATALCSADMYPMDSYNGLSNQFLYYFILSDSFTEAVILDSDRVAMPKINRESLSDYKLPIPPINEQLKIIDFIEMTGKHLDCLETKAVQAIQLMQERRTALISAAVTGKIDVRSWQHPNQKNNNHTELSA